MSLVSCRTWIQSESEPEKARVLLVYCLAYRMLCSIPPFNFLIFLVILTKMAFKTTDDLGTICF